jgi:hypothetical protein
MFAVLYLVYYICYTMFAAPCVAALSSGQASRRMPSVCKQAKAIDRKKVEENAEIRNEKPGVSNKVN